MKKELILSILFALGFSSPVCSQSFLKDALKKVDKVLETTESILNGKEKEDIKQADNAPQESSAKTKFITSLSKTNLKGAVKNIIEVSLWDGIESQSTYRYNFEGMIEEYTCEDGVVSCAYSKIDGIPYLANLSVRLSDRDYAVIEWEGRQYMTADVRYFFNNEEGHLVEERGIEEKIKYTYLNGGRIVRADSERKGVEIVPSFFIYNESGKLIAEYSEKMEGEPVCEIRYDEGNRKVYEKEPDGVVREYRYNDNGEVVYRKTSNTFGHDEDSEDWYTYAYDIYGNWTEKIWRDGDNRVVCIYNRKIEYYK